LCCSWWQSETRRWLAMRRMRRNITSHSCLRYPESSEVVKISKSLQAGTAL
jgi:hypothetical protein